MSGSVAKYGEAGQEFRPRGQRFMPLHYYVRTYVVLGLVATKTTILSEKLTHIMVSNFPLIAYQNSNNKYKCTKKF